MKQIIVFQLLVLSYTPIFAVKWERRQHNRQKAVWASKKRYEKNLYEFNWTTGITKTPRNCGFVAPRHKQVKVYTDEMEVDTFLWTTKIIFHCASIISHIVVAVTIYRNKILKRPVYMYILSIMFCKSISSIRSIVLRIWSDAEREHFHFFCVFLQLFFILEAVTILTLIAVTLKYPVKSETYARFIKGMWMIVILASISFIITNFTHPSFMCTDLFSLVFVTFIFILFLVLLVLHITCRIFYRKQLGDYALQLNFVSVYISCHIFYYFWWIVVRYVHYTYAFTVIGSYTVIYSSCYGVVNAVTLMCFDRKFRICLLETLKCSKSRYFDTNDDENRDEITIAPIRR